MKRQRDDFHWSRQSLLSHNKTFNYAVSGRGPGKTTDTAEYMMNLHKKGFMMILLRRQIVDVNETSISDFQNAYNILQDDGSKIKLNWKKGDMKTGICDVYIEGEDVPFFRLVALSNPKYRLKGMAFDRPIGLIVFDEYKISGTEKYLPDEYSKFQELYSTLARFGPTKMVNGEEEIIPPRVLFLGNNYSLTDPYMAHMGIDPSKVVPGKILTGDNWAFEDILINDKLKEFLLKQNPLLDMGDDAYRKYALEGKAVRDERIQTNPTMPQGYKLQFVFYLENKYLCIYRNMGDTQDLVTPRYYITSTDDYKSERRDIIAFNFEDLIEGTVLFSAGEKDRFELLCWNFRIRRVVFKSVYEGFLFEQLYTTLGGRI